RICVLGTVHVSIDRPIHRDTLGLFISAFVCTPTHFTHITKDMFLMQDIWAYI
ncbi:hypothetical protein ACJX0J_020480, partial [Zea mays]